MRVLKPLYLIPEAGTHWFSTYQKHHRDKLMMAPSSFDPCLPVSQKDGLFGIVAMQIDDTLILGNADFSKLENDKLHNAKLIAKPVEILSHDNPLIFNGCKILKNKTGYELTIMQKDQGSNLNLVNPENASFAKEYVEQRARGAYIASICQPEAIFDLSVAAQQKNPTAADAKILNKRLQWQLENLDRGLRYISLDLNKCKLFVFVDASFANNKDYSSQIAYLIVLATETEKKEGAFTISGNIIHWASVKSQRVARSVLASELFAMVAGVDMAIAINTTINMILRQLQIDQISTIVCTNSFSLYECLVKLGTTKEKRLMIDIMALRQSYEKRELSEIRWINGQDNPADALTKKNPVKALEQFINTNELTVRVEGWVERGTQN